MRKRLCCAMIALLMLSVSAMAETYEGKTAAAGSLSVEAESGGILETLNVLPGSYVQAGTVLAEIATTKVFATQDGVVANLTAEPGDSVDGTVLQINPLEKYHIYCTVDEAYESAETMLVHSGEQVYVQCTKNGTHCATGFITELDGSEYRVITTGGELYVGETVYLYRDAEFSAKQRIGIGTVVESDSQSYSADGTLVSLSVQAGEYVERGELLYEYVSGTAQTITAEKDGIIQNVNAEKGDRVENGNTVMTLVPTDQICVEVNVDEDCAATLCEGDAVELIYACVADETPISGTITKISYIASDGMYTVRIQPEDSAEKRIGLTVEVRF